MYSDNSPECGVFSVVQASCCFFTRDKGIASTIKPANISTWQNLVLGYFVSVEEETTP